MSATVVPLLFVAAWIVTGFGLIFMFETIIPLIIGIILFYCGYRAFKYTKARKTTVLYFNYEGLEARKKLYRWGDISSINFDTAANNARLNSAFNSVSDAVGYYIYLQFGSERIPIVLGLSRQNIQEVYDQVVALAARFREASV